MIHFSIVKKKISLFILLSLSLSILLFFPCNLLFARKLRQRKKIFKKNSTQQWQRKKKDTPKTEQINKKKYSQKNVPFKDRLLKAKTSPDIKIMSKTQDQKSSPAINPLSISHFLKKKNLPKKPPRIRSANPDHSPSLTKDEKGNLYLVWEHGNELWWAGNKGNDGK